MGRKLYEKGHCFQPGGLDPLTWGSLSVMLKLFSSGQGPKVKG